MARVAHVMAGAVHGGAELFFERLCVALHESGETILPVIRHDPQRASRLRAAGLEPVQLAFGGPLDPLTTPRLRRALRQFRPDVVVSWMNRATAHTPRGGWVHVGRLGGYYDLRHYRACDHLVGNTRGIVGWLRRCGWSSARSHYLPNFVEDLAGTAPAPDLVAGPRPLILGLGRLHTDKGFDTLIRAARALPQARVVIAGAGPELRRLRDLAARPGVAGRVHLVGWRQDVAAMLAAADVFACSSRVEPLGNMVIEAWSAGRAVVAGDADGPRELINPDDDGFIVPREDPSALAAALARAIHAPELTAHVAGRGRSRFLAEFSRPVVVAKWRRFLADLAAPPGPS